jgi:uracil-DNA glycosylase
LTLDSFIDALARARIGVTYNQYGDSPLRRERLRDYLERRRDAAIMLVGEAAGYRGARVSGLPFTSERQLTGTGPGEATATIVQRVLAELGLVDAVLLWNLVPTHPHRPGEPRSNRAPTRAEVAAGAPFLAELRNGLYTRYPTRLVLAVGRLAHRELGGEYVRHPSHGGASEFRARLVELLR